MAKRITTVAAALAMTAMAAAAPAAAQNGEVGVGHSGWEWGNPQPQGNTLRAVEFAGGVGYAAGDFGTLLRTTNSGLSWEGIPTGITANLSRIRAVNESTVLIGAGCVLRRSDDGGQTFRRVPFVSSEANCPAGLASFHFPSAQTGYLVLADGTVSVTNDGGQTFSGRTAVPGTAAGAGGGQARPSDIFFVDEVKGFVTAGNTIYRTTDGGNSWTPQAAAGATLRGLLFTDAATGYAVGDSNTLFKTTDGGDTWSPRGVPAPPRTLTQIRCASSSTCLISTAEGDQVLRTTNGGDTVTAVSPSTRRIYAITFASPSAAVGVGDLGATVFSGDAGTATATPSFTSVASRLGGGERYVLTGLRATNATVVHAPGNDGKVARSTDGGKNWGTVGTGSSEDLRDVSFVDENVGFAMDDAQTLRLTGDGGNRWTPLDIGSVPRVNAIHAIDRNIAILFTRRGIFRSASASDTSSPGTTFEAAGGSKVQRTTFTDFDRTDAPSIFAWGPRALWVSRDRGASWRSVRGPRKKTRYRRVDFVSPRVGFAITTDGRLWSTRNGGRRWNEQRGLGTAAAVDMAFGDARNGYVVSPTSAFGNGTVMRTSDAGRTWRPQLVSPLGIRPGGLEAPAATTAFALSREGEGRGADLFHTETGGDQGQQTQVFVKASKKRLRRAGRIRLTVRIAPGLVGAPVALLTRSERGSRWSRVRVPGGSFTRGGGSYTVTVRVRRTSYFVAQWRGDADRNGDGSPAVRVRVGGRR